MNWFKKIARAGMCLVLGVCIVAHPVIAQAQGVGENYILPSGMSLSEAVLQIEEYTTEQSAEGINGTFSLSVEGETVYASNFGFADKENGVAVSENSVFEWGSASKLLIWTSVLQLQEKGSIDLNKDITEYLPEGDLKEELDGCGVTMEHLMNYSSGFHETYSQKLVAEGAEYGSLVQTLEETIPEQLHAPGTVVALTDWSCGLAAYIVECVSGMSYADYVKNNIFIPLHMDNTALLPDLSDNESVRNMRKEMKSYQGSTLIANNFYHISLYPAGMVTGSAADFHTYANELLLQNEESRLFENGETAERLFETTLYYNGCEEARVANGMFVFRYGKPVYGMSGTSATQTAIVLMDPESKVCFTYMSNNFAEKKLSGLLIETVFGKAQIEKAAEISGWRAYEGVYVAGDEITDGRLSFLAVLNGMYFKLDEQKRLVLPLFGNLPMFEMMDEGHVTANDGSIGNIYTHANGDTVIMTPMLDYVSYPTFMYFLQIISVILMVIGYFYSSVVLITGLFGFVMRKISKETAEKSKFCKYHYIQCLNVVLFSLVFAFMVIMTMSYAPSQITSTTPLMYWLGSVVSFIYMVFFFKTGRDETVSRKNKILYWITMVFAIVRIAFATVFGLIF